MIDHAISYARWHRQLARALARRSEELDAEDVASLRDAAAGLDGLLAGRAPGEQLIANGDYLTVVGSLAARVLRGKLTVPSDVELDAVLANLTRAADAIAVCDPMVVALASERARVLEAARLWHAANEAGPVSSTDLALYLAGAVATAPVIDALTGELAGLAEQLQALVGCRNAIHTDCGLRQLVDELGPRWRLAGEPAPQLGVVTRQLEAIVDAIHRFIVDCRCAAINPPCPDSDGDGVLLAEIEVDRCSVDRICNTVRAYVLAPATLRYWDAIAMPDRDGCCPTAPPGPGARPAIAGKLARLAAVRGGRTLRSRLVGEAAAPAPDPAALARELAELRRSHAALEQRLAQLEAPRTRKPAAPGKEPQ